MKNKIIQLFRINILIALLIACTLAGTLNSCVTSAGITYQNYTPPAWAPPYDDVSAIHYYYFPDYGMYYDAWENQFWYSDNGIWASSAYLPPMYSNIDLNSAYIVLINKKYNTPWQHHDYYARNYPAHSYDNYKNIVVNNRIIKNVAPNHELVPRAFNENTNRVTFMQRQIQNKQPDNEVSPTESNNRPQNRQPDNEVSPIQSTNRPQNRQPNNEVSPPSTINTGIEEHNKPQNRQPNNQVSQMPSTNRPQTVTEPNKPVQPTPTPAITRAPQYNHVSHEVPIKTIKPFMPPEAQNLNYGRGFKKH